MNRLNYNHLYYFWVAVRTGSLAAASSELHLAQSTVSKQLKNLEEQFGHELFDRSGRRLVPNDFGQNVFKYANEIFSIGHELADYASGKNAGEQKRLRLGLTGSVPKYMIREWVAPMMGLEGSVQFSCYEGKLVDLVDELIVHQLDVVVTDRPLPAQKKEHVRSRELGESPVAFFGAPEFAETISGPFPESLDEAQMLLPTPEAQLRRKLDTWFVDQDLSPRIVGQFQDIAQMKSLGQAGMGIFPLPTIIEKQTSRQYEVRKVGNVTDITETFFAIVGQRQLDNSAVERLIERAVGWLSAST